MAAFHTWVDERMLNHMVKYLGRRPRCQENANAKPRCWLGLGVSADHYTATSSATPITISAMPESSRLDSGCLKE
jgi:hypothetical protein